MEKLVRNNRTDEDVNKIAQKIEDECRQLENTFNKMIKELEATHLGALQVISKTKLTKSYDFNRGGGNTISSCN